MPRVHLSLVPLAVFPVLAAVVAFSACSRPHGGEPTPHVIPPAVALPPPAPPAASAGAALPDEPPSEEEVKAFERPVAK